MNILIYDDNKNDVNNLLDCINNFFKQKNYKYKITVCDNEVQLFKSLNQYDLIILSVEANKGMGIEIGTKIRKKNQVIRIILTSYDIKHVFEGYKVHADRYLVKPLEQNLFDTEFNYLVKEIFSKYEGLDDYKICPYKIYYKDIIYIEFINRKTYVHLRNGKLIETSYSLKYWEEKLINHPFYKPHKAYLLNLRFIKNIIKDEITLQNNEIIHLSRSYKRNLIYAYVNYLHTFCH